MKCKKIQKYLSALMDNEADPGREDQLKEHLASCEFCSKKLKHFGAVYDLLNEIHNIKPDTYFLTRLNNRIEKSKSDKKNIQTWSWRQKVLVPATICAGLVFGIFLGFQLFQFFHQPEQISQQQQQSTHIDTDIFNTAPSGSITATYVTKSSFE